MSLSLRISDELKIQVSLAFPFLLLGWTQPFLLLIKRKEISLLATEIGYVGDHGTGGRQLVVSSPPHVSSTACGLLNPPSSVMQASLFKELQRGRGAGCAWWGTPLWLQTRCEQDFHLCSMTFVPEQPKKCLPKCYLGDM